MQTATIHQGYAEMLARLVEERLVREPERRAITGISKAQWYRLELAGRAPKRIPVSERIVAWKLSDLQAWVRAKASRREWTSPPEAA